MKRRVAGLLLSLLMVLSLTGCRSGDYKKAAALAEAGNWQEAREIFSTLGDYKDAADKVTECDYRIALERMEAGDYNGALGILQTLDDYADAAAQRLECRYLGAAEALKAGRWDEAAEAFKALGDYKDAAVQVLECRYLQAAAALDGGRWDEAAAAFEALGDYKDAADMVLECSYRRAAALADGGDYDGAAEIFRSLGDYRDARDRRDLCLYEQAMGLYERGEYEAAYPVFLELEDYRDAAYYSVLSILQYDPQTFVDTFAQAMDQMFQAGNLPLSMTESVVNYQRDARHFTLDRVLGGREVSMSFEPSFSDGSVTSRGQISSIHVMGDTRTVSDIETTLTETLISSVLALIVLDESASAEELTVTLGQVYADMLAKFPGVIPETGHFERVEIPYGRYDCVAAMSFWPNYYRFLFTITTPELVKEK